MMIYMQKVKKYINLYYFHYFNRMYFKMLSFKDKKVTIRDRDTTKQERIKIEEVVSIIKEKL